MKPLQGFTDEEIEKLKIMQPGKIEMREKPKIPTRKFLTALGFLTYYENGPGQGLSITEAAEVLSELIKDDY
jgi:hypothetical protein